MRVLCICLLMIGSINCLPQGGVPNMAVPRSMWLPYGQEPSRPTYEEPSGQYGGYPTFAGSYSPEPQTGGSVSHPQWYTGSYPEQEPARPTYHQRPAQSSGVGSYSGVDSGYSGSGSQHSGSQHSGSQGPQSAAPGSQYQVEQESWSSSDDDEEPEFTPVSDEDQVYAFKTRSRYNQKRLLFSQFRYTPTEPRIPQEPVFPYPSKSHQGKGSAKGSR